MLLPAAEPAVGGGTPVGQQEGTARVEMPRQEAVEGGHDVPGAGRQVDDGAAGMRRHQAVVQHRHARHGAAGVLVRDEGGPGGEQRARQRRSPRPCRRCPRRARTRTDSSTTNTGASIASAPSRVSSTVPQPGSSRASTRTSMTPPRSARMVCSTPPAVTRDLGVAHRDAGEAAPSADARCTDRARRRPGFTSSTRPSTRIQPSPP